MAVGRKWSEWTYAKKATVNWVDDALADGVEETSDEISLEGTVDCEVGVQLFEDDTGDISGDVTIYLLRSVDGAGAWEVSTAGTPFGVAVTPIRDAGVYKPLSVGPTGGVCVSVKNACGQELTVTVMYRTATIDTIA